MPNPFISRQDLTDVLGRDVTADEGALAVVDAACDMCRTFAEQDFNLSTSTITLDGTGTDALLLPQLPVSAAGTVTVASEAVTDYVLNDDGMLIRKAADTTATTVVWPWGRQNVVVTYDHGYADEDIPRDVRMVALQYASRLIVQGPALSESSGQQSIVYAIAADDLTKTERAILRKYKR